MSIANASLGRDAGEAAAVAESISTDKKQGTAALGKMFSWGSGDFGRLGHGDSALNLVIQTRDP